MISVGEAKAERRTVAGESRVSQLSRGAGRPRDRMLFLSLFGLSACGGTNSEGPALGPPPPPSAPPQSTSGIVVDGPIAGATVFIDEDGDSVLDAGEVSTTTDVNGGFEIEQRDGVLIASGGVDTTTGVRLDDLRLVAPADATVISPLTTLAVEVGDQALVKSALGLGQEIDLFGFDPIAQLDSGDAVAAQAVLQAGQLALTTLRGVSAVLQGLGVADPDDVAVGALAQVMALGPADLGDPAVVRGLLDDAVDDGALPDAVLDAASDALARINGRIDGQTDALSREALADAIVGQIEIADRLRELAEDPNAEAVQGFEDDFSDEALDALTADIEEVLDDSANADRIFGGLDRLSTDKLTPLILTPDDDDYPANNDTAIDGGELRITSIAVSVEDLDHIEVVLGQDGTLTITPLDGFFGTATFSYFVQDEAGFGRIFTAFVEVADVPFLGTAGDDFLSGTAGDDIIFGFAGDDTIHGEMGNDTIEAGPGNDLILEDRSNVAFGEDNDVIDAGPGDDTILVGTVTGNDRIIGGDGHDVVVFTSNLNEFSYDLVDNGFTVTRPGPGGSTTTISGVEELRFANNATWIVGDDGLNAPFVVGDGIADQTVVVAGTFELDILPLFDDVDLPGEFIVFDISVAGGGGLPLGVSFLSRFEGGVFGDGSPREGQTTTASFFGTPTVLAVGDYEIVVTVTDTFGLSVQDSFILTVTNPGQLVQATAAAETLVGGPADTLSYEGSGEAVIVDLASGTASGGDAEGDTVSGFGGLIGSAGDDHLTGSAQDNQLIGGAGHDTLVAVGGRNLLFGGLGDDTLTGGRGDNDTALFSGSRRDYDITFVAVGRYFSIVDRNPNDGDEGTDRLNDIRFLQFADAKVELGVDPNNPPYVQNPIEDQTAQVNEPFSFQVLREAFNDFDLASGDVLTFTATLADDSPLPAWLNFDPATRTFSGTPAAADEGVVSVKVTATDRSDTAVSDVFEIDVEGGLVIIGTSGDDVLVGGAFDDRIWGGDGDDILIGLAGADDLQGQGGVDTVDYSASNAAVDVWIADTSLSATPGVGGHAQGDRFETLHNVIGSAFDDVIVGNERINVLSGGAGNDTLFGGGGNDTLFGGEGDDTLTGGDRDDTIYALYGSDLVIGGGGADTISGNFSTTLSYAASAAAISIDVAAGVGLAGDALGDQITGVKQFVGTAFSDVFSGHAPGQMTIDGGDGSDVFQFTGIASTQVLIGGDGDDEYRFGESVVIPIVDGGEGRDSVDFSEFLAAIRVRTGPDVPQTYLGLRELVGIEVVIGTDFNDTIVGTAADEQFFGGAGRDLLIGGRGADLLDGGDGHDLTSYLSSDQAISLALDGSIQPAGGAAGDVLISIEEVEGSRFDDLLIGDDSVNILRGDDGDDIIIGGATNGAGNSDDLLIGGEGNDLIYGFRPDGEPGPDTPTATGPDQRNRMDGGPGDDILIGGTGFNTFNTMNGGEGNDRLIGGSGSDFLTGGPGADYLDAGVGGRQNVARYFQSDAAVQINLALGTVAGGHAEGDVLVNVTDLTGSAFDDVLIGDERRNLMSGSGGDDYIEGGGGFDDLRGDDGDDTLVGGTGDDFFIGGWGADRIDGGEGSDTAAYIGALEGVMVDLSLGSGLAGEAEGDELVSIENLSGTSYDDVLTGSDDANILRSRGGDDIIKAGAGDDLVDGGLGADQIDGGGGIDTLAFNSLTGLMQGVVVDLRVGAGLAGVAEGDSYSNIEAIFGTPLADVLVGAADTDALRGSQGDDVIVALDGSVLVVGGHDDDLLVGGGQVSGGTGADTFVFVDGTPTTVSALTINNGPDTYVVSTDLERGAADYVFDATVGDFVDGEDLIDVSDLRDADGNVLALADILDNTTTDASGAVLDLSTFTAADGGAVSGTLTLEGVTDAGALTADDFVFDNGIDWLALLPQGVDLT